MKKEIIVDAFRSVLNEKMAYCRAQLEVLPETCSLSRTFFVSASVLYEMAQGILKQAGDGEDYPECYTARLLFLLKGEREWYWRWRSANTGKPALTVYLYNVLYWREEFVRNDRLRLRHILDSRRRMEVQYRLSVAEGLARAYQQCWEQLGGDGELRI